MMDDNSPTASEFVDTSLIVRYLIQDSPDQTEQTRRIVEEHPLLLVTAVTVAEAGFVLTRFCRQPREAVVDALIALLRRSNISVYQLDTDTVIQALLLCRPSGRISFADAMLWASARESGTGATVYTLDRRFPSIGITLKDELSN